MVSHNWGDIIPYPISFVIRVYDFLGRPHVLSFYLPLKIGIVDLLWHIGTIEERDILGKGKDTFFLIVTVAHDFFFFKERMEDSKFIFG